MKYFTLQFKCYKSFVTDFKYHKIEDTAEQPLKLSEMHVT